MTTRSKNGPGVYTYVPERAEFLRQENDRLKRWATPLIRQGYRFEELTAIHTPVNGTVLNGLTRLTALGISTKTTTWRWTLWARRQWRKIFVYGCLDIVVGGEWQFWKGRR
jgi:hypothetical protein